MEEKIPIYFRLRRDLAERLRRATETGRYKKTQTQIMENGLERELDEIEKRERRK